MKTVNQSQEEKKILRWPSNYVILIDRSLDNERLPVRFLLRTTDTYDLHVCSKRFTFEEVPRIDQIVDLIKEEVSILSVPFFLEESTDLSLDHFCRQFAVMRALLNSPKEMKAMRLEYWDRSFEPAAYGDGVHLTCEVMGWIMRLNHDPSVDQRITMLRIFSMLIMVSPISVPFQDSYPTIFEKPSCAAFMAFYKLSKSRVSEKVSDLGFHLECKENCQMHDFSYRRRLYQKRAERATPSYALAMLTDKEYFRMKLAEYKKPLEALEKLDPMNIPEPFFCDEASHIECVNTNPKLDQEDRDRVSIYEEIGPLMETMIQSPPISFPYTGEKLIDYDFFSRMRLLTKEGRYATMVWGRPGSLTYCVYLEMAGVFSCGYGPTEKKAIQEASAGIYSKYKYGRVSALLFHHRYAMSFRNSRDVDTAYQEAYDQSPIKEVVLILIDCCGRLALVNDIDGQLDFVRVPYEEGTPESALNDYLRREKTGYLVIPQSVQYRLSLSEGIAATMLVDDHRSYFRDLCKWSKYFTMVDFNSISSLSVKIAPGVFRNLDHLRYRQSFSFKVELCIARACDGPLFTPKGYVTFQSQKEAEDFFAQWQHEQDPRVKKNPIITTRDLPG